MGHKAVTEQCRAIDEWRAAIGKVKQETKPASTAALEAKVEALCRERLEQAYRDISGARTACDDADMRTATWAAAKVSLKALGCHVFCCILLAHAGSDCCAQHAREAHTVQQLSIMVSRQHQQHRMRHRNVGLLERVCPLQASMSERQRQ